MSSEKLLKKTLVEFTCPQERKYDEATIHSLQKDGTYHLIKKETDKECIIKNAKLAASCVMTPNEGDLVQIYITPNQIYIMATLEKVLPVPSEYKLNGKVTLGINESQLVIDTNQINMKSKTVNIKAENISLISKATKSISKLYKNITEFIVETANMRSTKITGEDQLEADSKRDTIHSTHFIQAKRSVQANETTALNTQKYNINGGQKETIQ